MYSILKKSGLALLTITCLFSSNAFADKAPPDVISVSFKSGSSYFNPADNAGFLKQQAPLATMIFVSGRTSANKYSKADENIALRRAVAARDYLVKAGASPLRVFVNYASAMDYETDNSDRDGKAINQRVVIELIY